MSEPNAVRGEFEFQLGEHKLVMVPRFSQISKIEAALGRPLLNAATSGLTIAELAMIIDLLAKPTKPKLTRDEIGDLILDHGGVVSVGPAIVRTIERVTSGGDKTDAEGNESAPASAG